MATEGSVSQEQLPEFLPNGAIEIYCPRGQMRAPLTAVSGAKESRMAIRGRMLEHIASKYRVVDCDIDLSTAGWITFEIRGDHFGKRPRRMELLFDTAEHKEGQGFVITLRGRPAVEIRSVDDVAPIVDKLISEAEQRPELGLSR